MNLADQKLISAWQKASKDLEIEIETNYVLSTEEGKVNYPVFVKNFGSKRGTIVVRHELFKDFPKPEKKVYHISAVNAEAYSNYDREYFIETLEDWGYFGPDNNRPNWYEGPNYGNG